MNNRKRKVIEASLQLFTEKGFQQTSIQDILNKAQISKGTFYNYFNSKNECLFAILEQRRYEANLIRNEMLVGQDKTSIPILIKQTTVFVEINQRQNLTSVFEEIFHSGDPELKKIVSFHRLYELDWLSNRFVDVFGEEARPYSYECAVLFMGMKQHLAMSWRDAYETTLDPLKISQIVMRNIQAILPKMIDTEEVLLDDDTVYIIQHKLEKQIITKDILIDNLIGLQKALYTTPIHSKNGEELCSFLLEELERDVPRYTLIQASLKPFRNAFEHTPHQADAREISNYLWSYLKKNEE